MTLKMLMALLKVSTLGEATTTTLINEKVNFNSLHALERRGLIITRYYWNDIDAPGYILNCRTYFLSKAGNHFLSEYIKYRDQIKKQKIKASKPCQEK